ncbi:hypothetical protein BpHYR1_016223, partial [Brachionus plicatilis]
MIQIQMLQETLIMKMKTLIRKLTMLNLTIQQTMNAMTP